MICRWELFIVYCFIFLCQPAIKIPATPLSSPSLDSPSDSALPLHLVASTILSLESHSLLLSHMISHVPFHFAMYMLFHISCSFPSSSPPSFSRRLAEPVPIDSRSQFVFPAHLSLRKTPLARAPHTTRSSVTAPRTPRHRWASSLFDLLALADSQQLMC